MKVPKKNYAIEELTAELTASFTALELWVSNTLREENAKYLKFWCNVLNEEPTIILTILADVIKSSKLILERLEENNSKTKKLLDFKYFFSQIYCFYKNRLL